MNEHEIIGTELATNEVINEVTDATACEVPTGAKIAFGALLGLGAWKAGELVVKGFRWVKAKVKDRKNAKAKPETPNTDDEFTAPKVDEGKFDV